MRANVSGARDIVTTSDPNAYYQCADLAVLRREIAAAKQRFQQAADAPALRCFQAGRDHLWL